MLIGYNLLFYLLIRKILESKTKLKKLVEAKAN